MTQPDISKVVESSEKQTYEEGVNIASNKLHVLSQQTKCWLFFPVPETSFTYIDGKKKRTISTLRACLLKERNKEVKAAYFLEEVEN